MNTIKKKKILHNNELVLCVVIIVLIAVFAATSSKFLTVKNLFGMIRNYAEIGMVALGMTCVMLTGGIDLSVNSIVALCAVLIGIINAATGNMFLAIGISFVVGILCGLFNGFLIGYLHVPALVATLCTTYAYQGIALGISSGKSFSGYPQWFKVLGQGNISVFPIPMLVLLVFFIIFHLFLEYSYWGRYFRSMGNNDNAVTFSGINAAKINVLVYTISGIMSFLATLIYVSRVATAKADAGNGYAMSAITMVVLGGCSITGGSGRVSGTALGLLIMCIMKNGLTLLRIDSEVQDIIVGVILVAAVVSGQMSKAKASRRRLTA